MYRVQMTWNGRQCETLADIVGEGLAILFVALNPSLVSVAVDHYHRGLRGRQLWRFLERAGLLPAPPPGAYHDDLLLARRMGITDIVKWPSPVADLPQAEFDYGRPILLEKILRLRPRIVCAVYKTVFAQLLQRDLRHQWGLLPERIGESRLFALPFPPGKYTPPSLLMEKLAELKTLYEEELVVVKATSKTPA